MILKNRSPKFVCVAVILFLLLAIPFSSTGLARHRRAAAGRARQGRTARGGRTSARERRGRRGGRSAKAGRGRTRVSAREVRAAQKRVANEQSSAVKALERKLHRPLNKRERAAEMRRIEGKHRRELEIARRRAEAARRAAIARQRALDEAARREAQSFIANDDTKGEDPEVRRVAVNALGNHAGTVVVMDPKTGRVYTVVNQEWGLRRGFKPCSTVKLVTGLAGLNEKVIDTIDLTAVADNKRMDLTEALAVSNNPFFQQVGGRVGFDKMMLYARELGLGERTGINAPNEFAGRLPLLKSGYALNHMSSHGDDFEVTAVQLATLVSSMANGGKLLVPHIPRTQQEDAKFKPMVRRQVHIDPDAFERMVPGMVGSVNYGSGRRAYDPSQTVAGKTGTCIQQGDWIGLFTSYAPLVNPRLAVVVIARRTDAHGHFPAAVAGQIYRDLNRRFGTPIDLPIAAAPNAGDPNAIATDEDKEVLAAQAAQAEAEAADDGTPVTGTETTPTATGGTKVRRVLQPIPPKPIDKNKTPAGNKTQTPPKNTGPTEERQRRVNGDRP